MTKIDVKLINCEVIKIYEVLDHEITEFDVLQTKFEQRDGTLVKRNFPLRSVLYFDEFSSYEDRGEKPAGLNVVEG